MDGLIRLYEFLDFLEENKIGYNLYYNIWKAIEVDPRKASMRVEFLKDGSIELRYGEINYSQLADLGYMTFEEVSKEQSERELLDKAIEDFIVELT